jgi:hypothetical protein
MPFVEENPAVADSVASSQSEDGISYQEMCQLSVENADKFQRGRRPTSSAVRGEVTLRRTLHKSVDGLIQSLSGLMLAQAWSVERLSCRLKVEIELEDEESEGEEDDGQGIVCCKAVERYDDGIIIKTISPEGQVEQCSVLPRRCCYRPGGRRRAPAEHEHENKSLAEDDRGRQSIDGEYEGAFPGEE